MRTIISFISIILFLLSSNQLPSVSRVYKNFDPLIIAPPNYKLYEYMNRYHKKYGINLRLALNSAHEESGYNGCMDFYYKPFINRFRISSAGARGPLQVKTSTANYYWKDTVLTNADLEYNIEANVLASFKYQHYLYERYHNWTKVYSVYNQGWSGANNINEYATNITEKNNAHTKNTDWKRSNALLSQFNQR